MINGVAFTVIAVLFALAFGVTCLFYRLLLKGAAARTNTAEKEADFYRQRSHAWQSTAVQREEAVSTTQQSLRSAQQELQAARNSVAEQLVQLRDKDFQLADLRHRLELSQAEEADRAAKAKAGADDECRQRLLACRQHFLEKLAKARDEVEGLKGVGAALSADVETHHELAKRWHRAYSDLAALIAEHHAARGHGRCWQNTLKLYKAVGLSEAEPELPPLQEFIPKCVEYWVEESKRAPLESTEGCDAEVP